MLNISALPWRIINDELHPVQVIQIPMQVSHFFVFFATKSANAIKIILIYVYRDEAPIIMEDKTMNLMDYKQKELLCHNMIQDITDNHNSIASKIIIWSTGHTIHQHARVRVWEQFR